MTGAGLDRSKPPGSGPVRSFSFPAVHSSELDVGLGIRVVAQDRLPVVTAMLLMDAGESTTPGGSAGLGLLTGNALQGGTQRRSAIELAEALEGIGTRLGAATGWDSTTVSLTCTADRLPEAVRLLAEVVLSPGFPEGEVERIREQQLAALGQRKMYPAHLAADAAAHFLFKDGATYGRPLSGTEDTVAALGSEEVAGFAASRYLPERGGFVVVGDVDVDEVTALAAENFGGWSGAPALPGAVDSSARFDQRRIVVVHRPGAVQSEIRIGHPAVSRDTPDYFQLVVLNTILGGAFTSRLNLNLREKHGFTYGVRSRFAFRRAAGPFTISTAVGTDVTAAAVREAFAETEALVAKGPTESEVEAARDYMAGVFPLRLETTGQIASRIAELLVYRLPDDYHARYRDEIRAVTIDGVAAAARRRLHPGAMTVVVVGDADKVGSELEGLGLGPVDVRDSF